MGEMKTFDLYMFRNLFVATLFVAFTLAVVIFLTQSLRFLELVMNSGASAASFWVLTLLALPRFFEVILPLSMMASTLFIYHRMNTDSEIVVMRSIGLSPFKLALPAIILSMIVTAVLWGMTMWAAPASLNSMQKMRQVIKAQVSTLLFRENVFNAVMPGLTVYMRERSPEGDMMGLMIHDSREENANPSTILARRGVIVANDEGHQVLVYDGTRQEYNPKTETLLRLNFDRYTIDLPDSGEVSQRWRQPDERTISELLNPDMENTRDVESMRDFRVELHRRFVGPMLALVFTLVSLNALLLGPVDRRGMGRRIMVAVGAVICLQGVFLAAFNLSRQSDFGLVLMYCVIFVPMAFCLFLLMPAGENYRRRLLYGRSKGDAS